jgi:hypothetical protein
LLNSSPVNGQTGAGELTGAVVGDFIIERVLGRGGMGVVYASRHRTISRLAAIKVIGEDLSRDAEAVARFLREARAVARLRSPHIVDVFGFGTLDDGRAYCIMELLQGESLRERIVRARVPLDEAIDLLAQVCRGLEIVHDAGIVHRDLKPENLFIDRGRGSAPNVKILDFGLVKLAELDVAQTQTGVGFGTPLYAAPEQLRSARDVDERADIYSLGCIAYELVVGRVPFPRTSVAELIAAHLGEQPQAPRRLAPRLPPALDALIIAMLAKDPRRRPRIGHVQDVLEGLHRAHNSRAASIGLLDAPRPHRRWRWVAAATLVMAVIGIWELTSRGDRPLQAVLGSKRVPERAANGHTTSIPRAPTDASPVDRQNREVIAVVAAAGSSAPGPVSPPMRSASAALGSPSRVNEHANGPGILAITSKPPCDVWVDGRRTGRHTPVRGLELKAGAHRVTLTNDTYAIREVLDVEIAPGAVKRVSRDYSSHLPVDPNSTVDPFGDPR